MDKGDLNYQKIGELFVMQYYTQMHKDPAQMHRFYLEKSVFARGGHEMGTEEPVIGQKAIHEKILSLGLQQVHTKIRQVDSHATIANDIGLGIVVQVTGELSVAGQPMRPFVQTFVLAPESPKKYYIHNDIFRYQIYDEDMTSDTDVNDLTSEQDAVERPPSKDLTMTDEGLYRHQEGNMSDHSHKSSPDPSSSTGQPDPPSSGNWGDQYEEPTEGLQSNGLLEDSHHVVEESSFPVETNEGGPSLPSEDYTAVEQTKPPGTWASKLKGVSGSYPKTQSYGQAGKTTGTAPPITQTRLSNNVPTSQALPQREPKPLRKPDQQRSFDKKPLPSVMSGSTRSAPDSHQIFVGNLPNGTTEEELRNIFNKYGKIVEVRINPKNFGFVVFDNEESVHTIIGLRLDHQINLHDRKLNIEEKRPSGQKPPGGSLIGNRKPPLTGMGGGGGFVPKSSRVSSSKPTKR